MNGVQCHVTVVVPMTAAPAKSTVHDNLARRKHRRDAGSSSAINGTNRHFLVREVVVA
jgi:hypothetical protein